MVTERDMAPDPVLVGVDGSEESTRAVRWSAREAALRGTGLHVLHSWLWPLFHVPLQGSPMAPSGAGLQAQAERVLSEAHSVARSVAPDLAVETTLAVGEPATELLRRAPGASLVVVGNRGLGGFTGLLLGSTGIALSAHCPRPVVVVRGAERRQGPVAAAVESAGEADAVLRLAAREAALRGVDVVAVHCWSLGLDLAPAAATGFAKAAAQARTAGRELLDKAVARVAAEFDGVRITPRLGEKPPAAELVDASNEAQLLVVGARDLGPLSGMLLGSITHAVIHHAACPVMVER